MTSKPAGCKINVEDVAQRRYGLGIENERSKEDGRSRKDRKASSDGGN